MEIWRNGREFPRGEEFVQALVGRYAVSVERRAKLLVWRFENETALTAHLKMTGRFVFVGEGYERQKHDRIRFVFERGGERIFLVWADVRQFGFLKLVSSETLKEILEGYGPEPLGVSVEELATCFTRRSVRSIKALLLDQTVLAGVGNIYADEACYRAGIRPMRMANKVTAKERLRLAQEVQTVLAESIARQGTSANDYVDTQGEKGGFLELLRVYGREGESCRTCQQPIIRVVHVQRGTHYCANCQT
jgi:formamidopyrimidine-DNA glycosylase